MLQDIDHVRFCIALSTELYTHLIHPQCNEKEREHPIQLNTRRDLDPLHSNCNQRPAMGTSQMCNGFPKQRHQNTAPLSAPSNNHYRTRRQQPRDEPTARQLIIPWVTRSGAANRVPFLQRTRPRHAQPGERSPHTRYVLHTEIGNRFAPAIRGRWRLTPRLARPMATPECDRCWA
jgi:hypothetical protein